jgi:hypothetical protein
MPKELRQTHDNRGIKPLNSHSQLLRWELLVICTVQINIPRLRIRHRFHMVDLLESHVSLCPATQERPIHVPY